MVVMALVLPGLWLLTRKWTRRPRRAGAVVVRLRASARRCGGSCRCCCSASTACRSWTTSSPRRTRPRRCRCSRCCAGRTSGSPTSCRARRGGRGGWSLIDNPVLMLATGLVAAVGLLGLTRRGLPERPVPRAGRGHRPHPADHRLRRHARQPAGRAGPAPARRAARAAAQRAQVRAGAAAAADAGVRARHLAPGRRSRARRCAAAGGGPRLARGDGRARVAAEPAVRARAGTTCPATGTPRCVARRQRRPERADVAAAGHRVRRVRRGAARSTSPRRRIARSRGRSATRCRSAPKATRG